MPFQFQSGAIKGGAVDHDVYTIVVFQFQSGAIKGLLGQ